LTVVLFVLLAFVVIPSQLSIEENISFGFKIHSNVQPFFAKITQQKENVLPFVIFRNDGISQHLVSFQNMEFESGSKLIEVYIHALRKKIDEGHSDKLIHTLRGLGYRIGGHESY